MCCGILIYAHRWNNLHVHTCSHVPVCTFTCTCWCNEVCFVSEVQPFLIFIAASSSASLPTNTIAIVVQVCCGQLQEFGVCILFCCALFSKKGKGKQTMPRVVGSLMYYGIGLVL